MIVRLPRRRTTRREPQLITALALAMADIMAMILIMVVLKDPAFGVQHSTLPPLRSQKDPPKNAFAQFGPMYQVVIEPDGRVQCNDQQIPLDRVADRVSLESAPDQRILLIVKTDAAGVGALASYMQIQRDFAERELWQRVVVPFRRKPADVPVEVDRE